MRIADDRFSVVRCRAITSASFDAVVPSCFAIACKLSQNSFSSDTLVFCPLIKMERLKTADFLVMAIHPGPNARLRGQSEGAGAGNLESHQMAGLDFRMRQGDAIQKLAWFNVIYAMRAGRGSFAAGAATVVTPINDFGEPAGHLTRPMGYHSSGGLPAMNATASLRVLLAARACVRDRTSFESENDHAGD
jgi:hypothetical protein